MLKALVLALMLCYGGHAHAQPAPMLPGVAAFKRDFEKELRKIGVTDSCTYDVVDRQKDGPGVVIELDCKTAAKVCRIVIYDATQESLTVDDFDTIACEPKPIKG